MSIVHVNTYICIFTEGVNFEIFLYIFLNYSYTGVNIVWILYEFFIRSFLNFFNGSTKT